MSDMPPAIAQRLKPGLLWRPLSQDGWTLYDPAGDLQCDLRPDARPESLCTTDLDSNDRFWDNGSLRLDLYHQTQAIRRHVDGREANLEINYLCHYGCRHCFQSLKPSSHGEAAPATEELIRAADRLLTAGAQEISITGGDIFLHPGLWTLLDHLQRVAPRVTLRLLVNGGGLDPDEVRLQQLVGRRVLIKSDFFGHDAALHDDFTRVPGSFERLANIFASCRKRGIPVLATAALTRQNFETRFELVNFAFDLTDDAFSVATIIYPSGPRGEVVAELRLTPRQYGELLDETFFFPLTAEYHGFEPTCASDCQFAVTSATGQSWGCSFLKIEPALGVRSLPVLETVSRWRDEVQRLPEYHECATCPARATCRRCPSFRTAGQMGDEYCTFSRLAYPRVQARVETARAAGFEFVHPEMEVRYAVA